MNSFRTFMGSILSILVLISSAGCGDNPKAREVTKAKPEAKVSTNVRNGSAHETGRIDSLALHVERTSLNRDRNTTVNVTALYENNETEDVTHMVEWRVEPEDAVKIEGGTLTALKEGNVTVRAKAGGLLSNTVKLNIYWEVDGHRLPPEPDPKINNATLLGVDVNHNGVRDDVERWIYETYEHPIERGIFMQSARAYQKVIADPKKAHETTKHLDNAYSCRKYWFAKDKSLHDKYEYEHPSKKISKIQFNTIKRYIAYERFNAEFNGEVFDSPPSSKDKCEFDENGILKALP